jgi:branched-chain amino acid transport system substrate-binding protein
MGIEIWCDDAQKVMAQMKNTSVDDFFAKNGRIRDDGRMVHECTCSR